LTDISVIAEIMGIQALVTLACA